MTIWRQILIAARCNDRVTVERLLWVDLPLALRSPEGGGRSPETSYDGPLVKAALAFIQSLREGSDITMARSRLDDFIDFVADQIVSKVQRTSDLLSHCIRNPEMSVKEIEATFAQWNGLKRSATERLEWVRENLHSIYCAEICERSLSAAVDKAADSNLDPKYAYDERGLVKKWKMGPSWVAFKKDSDLSYEFSNFEDDAVNESIAAEAADYGVLREAGPGRTGRHQSIERSLEFHELGEALTIRLNSTLDDLDQGRPSDGYRPIAWHNVWWSITEKYIAVPLRLQLEDPWCETDEILAGHIARNFPGIANVKRLNIQRRRTRLKDASEEVAVDTVFGYLSGPGE